MYRLNFLYIKQWLKLLIFYALSATDTLYKAVAYNKKTYFFSFQKKPMTILNINRIHAETTNTDSCDMTKAELADAITCSTFSGLISDIIWYVSPIELLAISNCSEVKYCLKSIFYI